jgi:hypothetical protein
MTDVRQRWSKVAPAPIPSQESQLERRSGGAHPQQRIAGWCPWRQTNSLLQAALLQGRVNLSTQASVLESCPSAMMGIHPYPASMVAIRCWQNTVCVLNPPPLFFVTTFPSGRASLAVVQIQRSTKFMPLHLAHAMGLAACSIILSFFRGRLLGCGLRYNGAQNSCHCTSPMPWVLQRVPSPKAGQWWAQCLVFYFNLLQPPPPITNSTFTGQTEYMAGMNLL